MTKSKDTSNLLGISTSAPRETLRDRANKKIKKLVNPKLETLKPEETQRLLHELQVHQIELEMQKEELLRTQEELESSKNRFMDLYDFAPIGYLTLSEKGLIQEINITGATLFGLARSVLVNRPLHHLILPDDQGIYYYHHKALFEPGQRQILSLRLLRTNSSPFWARLETAAAQDEMGAPVCRVNLSDITASKNAEALLTESEQKYRTLADSGQALIWTSAQDKLCDYFNQPWLLFTGRTLEQEMGNGWTEGIHPEDFNRCLQTYITAFDRREKFSMEYRLRHASGKFRWIQDDGIPRYDQKGHFLGYIGHCLDITERKLAEVNLRASESRYRELVQSANSAIIRWDCKGSVLFFNEYAQSLFGYSSDEIVGQSLTLIVPEVESIGSDQSKLFENILAHPERHSINTYQNICRDGRRIWVTWTNKFICDEKGRVTSVLSVGNDITKRKQAENALAVSRANLEAALASMTDAVFISDAEGRFIDFNDAFATFHKFRNRDECPRTIVEYLVFFDVFTANGELAALEQWAVPRALRGEIATNVEYTLRRKDTGETWVGSYSFSPIRDQKGAIVGSVVVGRDITSSKEKELTKIRHLKDRYRAIIMDQNDMICRFDPQGRITFVNDAYCRYFDVNHEKILGTNFLPNIYECDLTLVQNYFKDMIPTDPQKTIEHQLYRSDGSMHWQQWCGRALYDDVGKVIEYQLVGRDITKLKQTEEKLHSEVKLRQRVIDGFPCIALLVEYNTWRIIATNKAAAAVGIMPGDQCFAMWMKRDSPCPWCLAPKVLESDKAMNDRFWEQGIYWDVHWSPVDADHYLHYAFDITEEEKIREALEKAHDELEQRVRERTLELQRTHAQLLHSEKLSAVGNLSASIAHEFNNPLQSVMTVLKGIGHYASLDEKEKKLVALSLQECHRMKNLIADLRDFHQPTSGNLQSVNLHVTIEALLFICKKEFHTRNITIIKKFAENLPHVTAVSDQLKQVLLNLLANATDACQGGGIITIATEICGESVVIHVEDNGIGISPTNIPHIFEPFFTTKPDLKGTGLGLPVSYGIIKNHGGHIDVTSEPGKGSKFSVFLPIKSVMNAQ